MWDIFVVIIQSSGVERSRLQPVGCLSLCVIKGGSQVKSAPENSRNDELLERGFGDVGIALKRKTKCRN